MAAVILGSFTRVDFWSMLFLGCITLILGLVLFYPSLLNDKGEFAINIFLAIVFVYAGLTTGFTLTQFSFVITHLGWYHQNYDFLRECCRVRFKCTAGENAEFDNSKSRIIFSRSTGLGLMIISFLLMLLPTCSNCQTNSLLHPDNDYIHAIVSITLYGLDIFLIIAASL